MTPEQNAELVAAIEELAPEAGFWIKGKPLDFTLEDIIWALQGKFKSNGWMDLEDEEERKLSLFSYDSSVLQICGHWKLGKPLSKQREETLAFLHSILCPTKG